MLGELLVTAGVFVFLFLGWQLWLNDLVVGADQQGDALALSEQFAPDVPVEPAAPDTDYGDPIISARPGAEAQTFANVYIPRFGADYVRTITEGVKTGVTLNEYGIGRYPDTQMPGELGNFAVAAHRTTYGAPFNKIADLQVGDRIYVQTADGWYTYVFRNLEYVKPTGVGVLDPVPQAPDVDPTARMMTMTSCNPLLSAAERIIAYSVYESWQPATAGPPAEIAALANGGA